MSHICQLAPCSSILQLFQIQLPWVHPLSHFLDFIHCPAKKFTHCHMSWDSSIVQFPFEIRSICAFLSSLLYIFQTIHCLISSRKLAPTSPKFLKAGVGPTSILTMASPHFLKEAFWNSLCSWSPGNFPSSSIVPLSTKISQVHPLSHFSRKMV
jgi:hypothetical protein